MQVNPALSATNIFKNIVFMGHVGAGKSTTCHNLIGKPDDSPFIPNNKAVSVGDRSMAAKLYLPMNIQFIDTPGFGDTGVSQDKIHSVLRELTGKLGEGSNSSCRVDAFILVQQIYNRAHSLKRDIDEIVTIYGKEVLRSLLILVIPGLPSVTKESFREDLQEMKPVVEVIAEAKGNKNFDEWFSFWSNKEEIVIPNQRDELFRKIQNLDPYTHEMFEKAELQNQLNRSQEQMNIMKEALEFERAELQNQLNRSQEQMNILKQALDDVRRAFANAQKKGADPDRRKTFLSVAKGALRVYRSLNSDDASELMHGLVDMAESFLSDYPDCFEVIRFGIQTLASEPMSDKTLKRSLSFDENLLDRLRKQRKL